MSATTLSFGTNMEEVIMSEVNKKTILQAYDELYSKGDIEAIPKYYTNDYIWHGPGGDDIVGHEGLRQMMETFREAFPDLSIPNLMLISDGEMAASQWAPTGTHKGSFAGVAPTGKLIKATATVIHRLVEGKIAEEWEDFDMYGILNQMGAIPSNP